ncbi:MAG: hypothetical protein D6794_00835, partial [Deltaproteobacteria bacterium]
MLKRMREVFSAANYRKVNDSTVNKGFKNKVETAMKDGIWRRSGMFRFAHLAFVAVLGLILTGIVPSGGHAASQVCGSDPITTVYNDYWDSVVEGYSRDETTYPASAPTLATHAATLSGWADSDDNKGKAQDETTLWSDGTLAAETAGTKPKSEYEYQSGKKYKYSWTNATYNTDPATISEFKMVYYFYDKGGLAGDESLIVMAYDGTDAIDTSIDLDGAGNFYVSYPLSATTSNCGGKDDKGNNVSVDYFEMDLTPLMPRLAAAGYNKVNLRIMAPHEPSGGGDKVQLLTQEVELAVSTCTPDPAPTFTSVNVSGNPTNICGAVDATAGGTATNSITNYEVTGGANADDNFNDNSLDPKWTKTDFGPDTGSVSESGQQLTIDGGGADIWNNADEFTFLSQ